MKTQEIYPGNFVPHQAFVKESDSVLRNEKNAVKPAINIKENDEMIFLEMMVPGVSRESFRIVLNDHHLEISVLFDHEKKKHNQFQVQEIDIVTYRRKIKLPENADTAFIQAQYKDGVLSIIVPKSTNPIECCQEQIFVY